MLTFVCRLLSLDDKDNLTRSPSFLCATTKGIVTQRGAKTFTCKTRLCPHFIFNILLYCSEGNLCFQQSGGANPSLPLHSWLTSRGVACCASTLLRSSVGCLWTQRLQTEGAAEAAASEQWSCSPWSHQPAGRIRSLSQSSDCLMILDCNKCILGQRITNFSLRFWVFFFITVLKLMYFLFF